MKPTDPRKPLPAHWLVPIDLEAASAEHLLPRDPTVTTDIQKDWNEAFIQLSEGVPVQRVAFLCGLEPELGVHRCVRRADFDLTAEQERALVDHLHLVLAVADAHAAFAFDHVAQLLDANFAKQLVREGAIDRRATALWLSSRGGHELLWVAVLSTAQHPAPQHYQFIQRKAEIPESWLRSVRLAAVPGSPIPTGAERKAAWQSTYVIGSDLYLVATEQEARRAVNLSVQGGRDAMRFASVRRNIIFKLEESRRVEITALRQGGWRADLERWLQETLAVDATLEVIEPEADGAAIIKFARTLVQGEDHQYAPDDPITLHGIEVRPFGAENYVPIRIPAMGDAPIARQLSEMGFLQYLNKYAMSLVWVRVRYRGVLIDLTTVEDGPQRLRVAFTRRTVVPAIKAAFVARVRAAPYGLHLANNPTPIRRHAVNMRETEYRRSYLRDKAVITRITDTQEGWIHQWSRGPFAPASWTPDHYWACGRMPDPRFGDTACDELIPLRGSATWNPKDDLGRDASDRRVYCSRGHTHSVMATVHRPLVKGGVLSIHRKVVARRVHATLVAACRPEAVRDDAGGVAQRNWITMTPHGIVRVVLAGSIGHVEKTRARAGRDDVIVVVWFGSRDEDASLDDLPHLRWLSLGDVLRTSTVEVDEDGVTALRDCIVPPSHRGRPPARIRSAPDGLLHLEVHTDDVAVNGVRVHNRGAVQQRSLLLSLVRRSLAHQREHGDYGWHRHEDLKRDAGLELTQPELSKAMLKLREAATTWAKQAGLPADSQVIRNQPGEAALHPTLVRVANAADPAVLDADEEPDL